MDEWIDISTVGSPYQVEMLKGGDQYRHRKYYPVRPDYPRHTYYGEWQDGLPPTSDQSDKDNG